MAKNEGIKTVDDIKENSYLWNKDNCRTYCIKCHGLIDGRRGGFLGCSYKEQIPEKAYG